MRIKKPLVSIIIANFNGEKYLSTCFNAVLATKYTPFEVLLVDDGSTDNSIRIIKRFVAKDKRVKLLRNGINIGAAASRNKAAKVANGEILVFLDNDTEVTPLWLSEMVRTLLKDKRIGGCQALLMDFEKRDTVQVAGTKLWAATGWGLPIGSGEKNKGQFSEVNIVALSAALAVRKRVFEKVGGFDELEAVVTEDLDLSWRIWIAGYRIVLSPKAIVYHWTKPLKMRKNMNVNYRSIYTHLYKNSLISMLKNYQLMNLFIFLPIAVVINLLKAIYSVHTKGLDPLKGFIDGNIYVFKYVKNIYQKRIYIQSVRKNDDKFLMVTILENPPLKKILDIYSIS